MQVRPQTSWKPIHPNYIAGVAAITAPFGFYPLWKIKNQKDKNTGALKVVIVLSYMLILFTIFMTTSRGVVLAIVGAATSWIIWKVVDSKGNFFRLRRESIFPIFATVYLVLVALFLFIGPESFTGSVLAQSDYGTDTRAQLFTRSLYFLREFPFTGGGLNSFPGLYSYYILDIPFFYLPNSHNLFLDVAIEQGILAGLAYLFLFLGSVWFVARVIVKTSSVEIRFFSWLVLVALIIAIVHGMVDDYLYNENGALLALFLIGISMMVRREGLQNEKLREQFDYRIIGAVAVIVIGVCLTSLNGIRSMWYANLGAVQMARVVLTGFPANGWTDIKIAPQLKTAEASLRSALRYDPNDPTANYSLGMILMLRRDFKNAVINLEAAIKEEPAHRGIIKNLGYCYAWLGETAKAATLLERVPEASKELGVYEWWWGTQNRVDLGDKASTMLYVLKISSSAH